ncbi:MAG TPA: putative glycoside hydrolase [Gemmatimonadales bacterium]
MTIRAWLWTGATLALVPPVAAQRVGGHPHHNRERPNYLAELLPPPPPGVDLPPPPPGEPPAVVRGIFMNKWGFGGARFHDLIRLADTTEINAFVMDIKDATGYLAYPSTVPTAVEIGANRDPTVRDPRARLALLKQHGIHPIARIVVARDPLLARNKPEWAIHDAGGGLWHDGLGDAWVDAYCDSVWVYAADIAAEAVLMGFDEIQFDYVRFPDEPPERLGRTRHSCFQPGDSKRGAVRRNLTMLRERVHAMGVPFTIDVFGLTTSTVGDLGIGQSWPDLLSVADVVLPMVYPSHYRRGAYGFSNPNREPYAVVRRALEDGLRRSQGIPGAARIRPYLQSFSIYRVRYTAVEVRAQIDAVEDVGLTDWILWNASANYPAGAFRPAPSPIRSVDDPVLQGRN